MASLGRKIARQTKRTTPEGKEQIKQEKADKQAALPPQNIPVQNQNLNAHQPQTRIRQRRAGNA